MISPSFPSAKVLVATKLDSLRTLKLLVTIDTESWQNLSSNKIRFTKKIESN